MKKDYNVLILTLFYYLHEIASLYEEKVQTISVKEEFLRIKNQIEALVPEMNLDELSIGLSINIEE